MELITSAAIIKSETAKGASSNAALNVSEALASTFMNKGEAGMNARDERIFSSMKNKLFMKYIGADYEVLLRSNFRNDKFLNALE